MVTPLIDFLINANDRHKNRCHYIVKFSNFVSKYKKRIKVQIYPSGGIGFYALLPPVIYSNPHHTLQIAVVVLSPWRGRPCRSRSTLHYSSLKKYLYKMLLTRARRWTWINGTNAHYRAHQHCG